MFLKVLLTFRGVTSFSKKKCACAVLSVFVVKKKMGETGRGRGWAVCNFRVIGASVCLSQSKVEGKVVIGAFENQQGRKWRER